MNAGAEVFARSDAERHFLAKHADILSYSAIEDVRERGRRGVSLYQKLPPMLKILAVMVALVTGIVFMPFVTVALSNIMNSMAAFHRLVHAGLVGSFAGIGFLGLYFALAVL